MFSLTKYIPLIIIILIFGGCAVQNQMTKKELYPKFYNQHPTSILVLPAVNFTTASNASEQYRYTITKELTEKGYYVFPVHLVDSFLKSENLPDPELVRQIPIKKLKEIFGADSILYVDIFSWDTNYAIFQSSVDVGFNFSLINSHTEEEIWHSNGFAHSTAGVSGAGVLDIIAGMIDAGINSSVDYAETGIWANKAAFNNMPAGKYRFDYKKDLNNIAKFSEDNLIYMDTLGKNFEIINNELHAPNIFMNNKRMQFGLIPKGKISIIKHPNFINGNSINNFSYTFHSDFEDYYYLFKEREKIQKRHRFFSYENGMPYILVDNKKVFIKTSPDGTLKYRYSKSYEVFSAEEVIEPLTGRVSIKNEEKKIVNEDAIFEIEKVIIIGSKKQ